MNDYTVMRVKAGLRQRQVAEALHISQSAISAWENGKAKPGIDILPFLATVYKTTIESLIAAANTQKQ